MNFDFSEEQNLFKDAIDRLVLKEYGFEQRREYAGEAGGWSREVWRQLAEQGFLALPFDEDQGGLGKGGIETMLVMEALGRALALEPYLGCIVVAGAALRAAASPAQLEAWVPALAGGERVLLLAAGEKSSRYRLDHVGTRAEPVDGGYSLSGGKIAVVHGDSADAYLVSARSGGAPADRDGIALFLVEADAPELRRRTYRTQDGLRAADLMLDQVFVPAGHRLPGDGVEALQRAAEAAIAGLAAESVGCMQALLDLTVDYLKQRKQFGGPIGRFQALQHRAAEMLIELEQARSMAMLAALMVDEKAADERARTLSAVKAQIGRSGRIVGELAVQLHGGIGVTEEFAVGHYFKRLTMIDLQFGDADFHTRRVAAAGGLIAVEA